MRAEKERLSVPAQSPVFPEREKRPELRGANDSTREGINSFNCF